MRKDEINRLLEKYYNAETSEDEEVVLRNYFRRESVSEEFTADKQMFDYYSEQIKVPEPDTGFEERIITALGTGLPFFSDTGKRRFLISVAGIAAGLLILTGSYFFLIHKSGPADTFSDPEIAYAAAMEVLFNVSTRLNQGAQVLEPVGKIQQLTQKSFDTFNRPADIIEEKLKTLNHLQKAIDVISAKNNQPLSP